MVKVFCGHCKHYFNSVYHVGDWCNYPDNKKDSYVWPASIRIKEPSELNANNDCKWFEQKPLDQRKWWRVW